MQFIDFYGYTPARKPRYRTCYSCVLSLGVVLGSLWGALYYLYILSTESYLVNDSAIAADDQFQLSPSGNQPFPEVGVGFRLRDGTFIKDESVVEILFRQRYAQNGFFSKDPELQDVRVPSELCAFSRDSEALRIESFCPKWGRTELRYNKNGFQRKRFIAESSRFNATIPEFQGRPHSARYAFLQATVIVDLEKVEDDPDISVADLFRGSVLFHVATQQWQLSNLNIRSDIKKMPEILTRSMGVKQTSLSKFDVEFSGRKISRRSALGNTVFFENTHRDVMVDDVKEASDDMAYGPKFVSYNKTTQTLQYGSDVSKKVQTPRQFALAQIFFRMSDKKHEIELVPQLVIWDIISSIGGVIVFFLFCCAGPALLMNRHMFNRAMKQADDDGQLPDMAFDVNGNMKPAHVDRVVQIVQERSTGTVSRLTAHVVPNLNIGSFQFRPSVKELTRAPSKQKSKSIFQWT